MSAPSNELFCRVEVAPSLMRAAVVSADGEVVARREAPYQPDTFAGGCDATRIALCAKPASSSASGWPFPVSSIATLIACCFRPACLRSCAPICMRN